MQKRGWVSEKRESESLFKEPLPKAGNPWRELFTYQALGRRWPGAGRAALALGISGSISLALGYDNAMLLVAREPSLSSPARATRSGIDGSSWPSSASSSSAAQQQDPLSAKPSGPRSPRPGPNNGSSSLPSSLPLSLPA